MANKYLKKYSILLIIKEMQITTRKFHLTPVRMANIKNTKDGRAGEDSEKRDSWYTVGENTNHY